jgi:acyl-CoA reductase-like NAD-dependent aldehyde dehydrogenase
MPRPTGVFGLGSRAMTRAPAAIFLLLAALVAVGCGQDDDSADQFRDGYNAAIQQLNSVNNDVRASGEELATRPGPEIAREFDRIAETAARTRADLAKLEPPEGAGDEFDELLAAIEDGVASIRAVANAARKENQQQFLDAREALSESGEEISAAENELKDAVESD